MNGFNIFNNENSIKEFQNNAGIFRLLVDDEMEVFESIIYPGKSIICQPYESTNAINIIFILKGKLFHTNKMQYVTSGQRITFKNLKETHHLSVIEKTKLIMIRNSKHFIKQATATDLTYDLIHQIQEKDEYTEDHCNKTGNLAVQIATIMKLSEKSIESLLYAGKIHDVGKINIPKSILNKPSSLTDKEYDIVKKHPIDGYHIALENGVDEKVAKIILEHHERLDGSGYPYALKKTQISIEARILAVVDSYDAMTSKRPYHTPKSKIEALKDLKKNTKHWYDPDVVDALNKLLKYID